MNFQELKISLSLTTVYILFILHHSLQQNFFLCTGKKIRIKFDRFRVTVLLTACKKFWLKFKKLKQNMNCE